MDSFEKQCMVSNTKHIEVLNEEMGQVRDRLTKIETNLDWLMKYFWIIATSSIGALVTGVITLISKK